MKVINPDNIISFIINPKFEGVFLYIKIVFISLICLYAVLILILLLRSSWLKRRFLEDIVEISAYRPFGAKKTFKQWAKIINRLDIDKESEFKLAIIEADSLLDDILKKIGYSGETLGERLKQLNSTILPNIDQVLQAHKTRNNVIHDPDYHLTLEEAKKTMGIYEKAFRDLEVF